MEGDALQLYALRECIIANFGHGCRDVDCLEALAEVEAVSWDDLQLAGEVDALHLMIVPECLFEDGLNGFGKGDLLDALVVECTAEDTKLLAWEDDFFGSGIAEPSIGRAA